MRKLEANLKLNESNNRPNIVYSNRSNTGVHSPRDMEDSLKVQVYQKRDIGADVNAIIAHASRVSGNDLDFIATLDKENAGTWSTHVKNTNSNGTWDIGICQFNSQYFMDIINDPNFDNPEWQVNKCLEMYRGWEERGILHLRFYAYPRREVSKKNFYLTTI